MEDIFVACLPVTQLCENLEIADVKEAEQEVECIDDDLSLDEATSRFINNELKWRNAANEKAKENSYTYQIRFYRPNQMKTTALKVWGKFTLALKMISQYALCFLEQLKLVARRNFSLKFSLVLLAFIGLLFTPKLNYNVEISLPQFTLPNLPDFAPPKYTTSKLTSKNEIEELKRYTQYLESRLEKLTNFTIEQQESLLRSIEALQSRDCTYAIKPDKTGLADYALESSGGEIVPEWTSRGLMTSYPLLKIWEIPLFYKTLSPRLAIQPQVNPGNCFGYNGMEGSIGIKLSRDIVVSAISIEHIPKVPLAITLSKCTDIYF